MFTLLTKDVILFHQRLTSDHFSAALISTREIMPASLRKGQNAPRAIHTVVGRALSHGNPIFASSRHHHVMFYESMMGHPDSPLYADPELNSLLLAHISRAELLRLSTHMRPSNKDEIASTSLPWLAYTDTRFGIEASRFLVDYGCWLHQN